ncbi:hypothetical protein L2E82_29498 [Cichorium intybus]|uniref:Uncharacterized protein n=1 Tax=Cichorium intybus TaxID=13427 RepID=A0ACB9CY44_CICIN|nr:hypothetical protein L2E82_29498 [Cichorium intybus]
MQLQRSLKGAIMVDTGGQCGGDCEDDSSARSPVCGDDCEDDRIAWSPACGSDCEDDSSARSSALMCLTRTTIVYYCCYEGKNDV